MSSESKNSNEIENDTNLSSKRNINKNIEKQQISTGDEHLKTESKNPSNKFSKRKKNNNYYNINFITFNYCCLDFNNRTF